VLNISGKDINSATAFVFKSLVLSNFLVVVGQPFTAILDSRQKIYITNICQFIYNFLYWGLILGVLYFFTSFYYIGIAILISSSIWFFLVVIFAFREWGKPQTDGYLKNMKRIAKKHFVYGLKLYSANLINFFYEPFTKLLITHLLGVVYVGYFDIGLRIKAQVFSLVQKIFHPIFPLISKLRNFFEIRMLVQDLQQKTLIIVTPCVVLAFTMMPTIISLWLGKGKYLIADSATFMLAGILLFSVTILPLYSFLLTKDHVGKTIIIQLVNVVVNFAFITLTYKTIGFYGIILGNPIALFVSFMLAIRYQRKYLGNVFFSNHKVFKQYLIFVIVLEFLGLLLLKLRFNTWQNLTLTPLIVIFVSIAVVYKSRLITVNDLRRYFGDRAIFEKLAFLHQNRAV
jgi:O-antigen/teichoic acid export membrane protein